MTVCYHYNHTELLTLVPGEAVDYTGRCRDPLSKGACGGPAVCSALAGAFRFWMHEGLKGAT